MQSHSSFIFLVQLWLFVNISTYVRSPLSTKYLKRTQFATNLVKYTTPKLVQFCLSKSVLIWDSLTYPVEMVFGKNLEPLECTSHGI